MKRILILSCAVLLPAICLLPGPVAGQDVGLNLGFNHSARYSGMGGAGAGSPWGRDTNHWANPAGLVFREGLEFRNFESQLATGLADDIELTHRELVFGNGTWALLFAAGTGLGNELDMGARMGPDEGNDVTGVTEEYIRSNSIGGALRLNDWLARFGDQGWRSLLGRMDLAAGAVYHDNEQQLAPDQTLQDTPSDGRADSWAVSWGFQSRIRLLEYMPDANGDGMSGLRLGLGLGWATLNDTRARFDVGPVSREGVQNRLFTRGWSARLALPVAPAQHRQWAGSGTGRLLSIVDPWLSVQYADQILERGIVWDDSAGDYEYDRDGTDDSDTRGKGWELVLLNVFSLRRGHIEAPYGDIDGDTEGWGLKLEMPGIGGLRYDYAEYPQARGLPDVERKEWAVWVDALALRDRIR